MSTYSTAEAALLTRIRAYNAGATFTTANSTRSDFRALDAKGTDVACVVLPGAPSEFGDDLGGGRGTHGRRQQRHTIAAVLFHKRGQAPDGDGEIVTTLLTLADAVVGWLDTYPRLNGAVKRAEVTAMSEPTIRRDSPHIFVTLTVEVLTETAPVLVEASQ